MPPGYTYKVANGETTELADFAMECARAFGALITMRDDPMDAPIPERLEPSTQYHDDLLSAAIQSRNSLLAMSTNIATLRAWSAHLSAVEEHEKYEAKGREERRRYDAMIAKVRVWNTDAEGIKSFMIEQLERGVEFDCPVNPSYRRAEPVEMDGPTWLAQQLAQAERDISYHTKAIAEEIERTAKRNEWLTALRESLMPAGQPS